MASKQDAAPPASPARKKIPKLKDTPGSSYYKGAAEAEDAKKNQSKNDKNDESLTTILTPEQRTDLIVLLAAATATMRNSISSTFDAEATLSPGLRKEKAGQDSNLNPSVDPAKADVEALDRERKMLAAREKELSGAKMQELKDASLEWFDNWRTAMIKRVGEVVETKKGAQKEVDENQGKIKEAQPVQQSADKKINPGEGKKESDARAGDEILKELYPAVKTPLTSLEEGKRVMILHSMLLLLLSLEHYAAPGRVLLLYLASSLQVPLSTLDEDEKKTAQGLLEAAKHMSGDAETEKRNAENALSRKWKVGLASVAGAAVVGITGGLAAPLVAAGVGSVMGGLGLGATAAAGYLGSVAGSTVIVGGLFGAYGGRMTGQMMDNYAKEVSDFAFIPVHPAKSHLLHSSSDDKAGKQSPEERRLRVTIGITGWLTEKEEVVKPWRVLGASSEAFALRWELESLMNLGNALEAMVTSAAWGYAKKEVIAHTIFADMMAAMWPIGLLQVSRVVDNPFSVAKSRAEKAGAVLADALINRAQGERPVTLVGYSLGARVIYACLLSLAARRAFGLIDSVILVGAPLPSDGKDWRVMRSVVAGRLVNVFSENDYVLGFLYRTSSIQLGVAGLQKVEGVSGVENIDVSEAVSGHLRYRYLMGSILRKVGFEDLDLDAVEREEEVLRKMDEEEERRKEELKKKIPYGSKKDDGKDSEEGGELTRQQSKEEAEQEAQKMEKDVQQKTQWSLMQKGAEWLHLGRSGKEQAEGEEKADEKKGSEEKGGEAKGYLSSVTSWAPKLPFGGKSDTATEEKAAANEAESGSDKMQDDKQKSEEEKKKEDENKPKSYLEMASGGYLGGGAKK
jgi:hypothetical protein